MIYPFYDASHMQKLEQAVALGAKFYCLRYRQYNGKLELFSVHFFNTNEMVEVNGILCSQEVAFYCAATVDFCNKIVECSRLNAFNTNLKPIDFLN